MLSEAPTTSPLRLLAFAGVRDVIGSAEATVDVELPCTAGELWPRLVARYPDLAPYAGSIRLAVNGTYATPSDRVGHGDEVALIPPVSGG
ncbi:MAG: MoaD/ThiS family protein [Myxococcales bacterium]|nr:MoaD/ThiS family protein [Myxococcales bacterium]